MEFLLVLIVVAAAVWIVVGPLRGSARAEAREDAVLADLRAAREAKYREIRDAEMDHRTGKLSDEDFRRLDRSLRAEAIDILRRLDERGAGEAEPAERYPAADA